MTKDAFIPAKPSAWLISLLQAILRIDLAFHNRVHIDEDNLQIFNRIPPGAGMILTPNHADEADPKVCLELSRLAKRRFMMMCNREAFDELFGMGGWFLQRIGVFSVQRGDHDSAAKNYSTEIVRQGENVFLIFPEGEIFYLNDSVQPFHSGAIEIGMQAVIKERALRQDWSAYLLPMAIKYRYPGSLDRILQNRVRRMEQRLSRDMSEHALRMRVAGILSELLRREEIAFNIQSDSDRFNQLGERVAFVRRSILEKVEQKHTKLRAAQSRTIDRAWQMSAHLRRKMLRDDITTNQQADVQEDLAALKEVAHLASWQPNYFESSSSQDRLAEVVLKLERELYQIKRPTPLAKRDVFVRLGEPIDLSQYLPQYLADPHVLRHDLSEHLRSVVQAKIDELQVR